MSQIPTRLERRARALLRAYPAEYRHGRAEEIIGTLLEVAPPGRSFPTAREAWSLIAGGRHARATRNRRPGVKANVLFFKRKPASTRPNRPRCRMLIFRS